MSEPKSKARLHLDQNLLFGVLALQAGLLDPVQLAEACSAWATRMDDALADLLVQRHWLTTEDRADVERLLERKVRKQGSRPAVEPAAATASPGPTPDPTGMTLEYIPVPPSKRYQRKKLHAAGGMGQIWRAHDPTLDREIAIKILRPDRADDHQFRERFSLEARIMGKLSHPGIPPIHVLDQDEMLRYQEPRDLLGKSLHNLIHHHRVDGTAYPLEECRIHVAFREGRGTHVADEVLWRADGTSFPAEYWSYPVRREGQLVGCVVSFLDITERVTLERELLQGKETATRACRAATTALEDLQRQLRLSLDEVAVMTANFQEKELPSEQRDHLERLRRAMEPLWALAAPRSALPEGTRGQEVPK